MNLFVVIMIGTSLVTTEIRVWRYRKIFIRCCDDENQGGVGLFIKQHINLIISYNWVFIYPTFHNLSSIKTHQILIQIISCKLFIDHILIPTLICL